MDNKDENQIKLKKICTKYPAIQMLDDQRVLCLYFGENEWDNYRYGLIISEGCDFCYYETLNSKDCEEISKCFLEISKLLKEMEERK